MTLPAYILENRENINLMEEGGGGGKLRLRGSMQSIPSIIYIGSILTKMNEMRVKFEKFEFQFIGNN